MIYKNIVFVVLCSVVFGKVCEKHSIFLIVFTFFILDLVVNYVLAGTILIGPFRFVWTPPPNSKFTRKNRPVSPFMKSIAGRIMSISRYLYRGFPVLFILYRDSLPFSRHFYFHAIFVPLYFCYIYKLLLLF